MHWSSATASLFVLALCPAQGTTWIVDAANGPGTNFTDLQAALASAQVVAGDKLIVRAGNYAPWATSKGVTILGEPGATVTSALPSINVVSVRDLGASATFALTRITIMHNLGATGLWLERNAGRVLLNEVTILCNPQPPPPTGTIASLFVNQSGPLSIHACSVLGGTGIEAWHTDLVVSQTTVQGWTAMFIPAVSTPAIRATGGTAWLSQVSATGGNSFAFPNPPSPAVVGQGTRFTIAGDARSSLTAGGYSRYGTPAIHATGGEIRIAPSVILVAFNTLFPIGGNATVISQPLPFLGATAAGPSGTLAFEVTSSTNDSVALALGLPGAPLALPFGTLHVDPATMLPLLTGVQGPSGRLALQAPVPNMPALRGLVLASQAANASGNSLALTHPVFFPLH